MTRKYHPVSQKRNLSENTKEKENPKKARLNSDSWLQNTSDEITTTSALLIQDFTGEENSKEFTQLGYENVETEESVEIDSYDPTNVLDTENNDDNGFINSTPSCFGSFINSTPSCFTNFINSIRSCCCYFINLIRCCCCAPKSEDPPLFKNTEPKSGQPSLSKNDKPKFIKPPSLINIAPKSEDPPLFKNTEPKSGKPPSLMNIGANCYLNSALQGISSCDIFLKELSELHKKYDNLDKLSLFHKLIDILNGGKSDCMEISRDPIFRNWNKPGQQDSFELMAYVMNQVYNEIRKYLEETGEIPKCDMQEWLKEDLPMRIIIEYKIICPCNNKVIVPLQSDLALHVAIPSHKSLDLQVLVDRFFQEEEIEDYKCENGNCNGKNTKRFTRLLQPLPKTLCIHLQRTFWNGRIMQKIDKFIKFTNQLKIKSEFSVFNTETNSQFNGTTQNKVEAQNDNYQIVNKINFETRNSNDETDINQEMENHEENNSSKIEFCKKPKIDQTSVNENINQNQTDTSHQHSNTDVMELENNNNINSPDNLVTSGNIKVSDQKQLELNENPYTLNGNEKCEKELYKSRNELADNQILVKDDIYNLTSVIVHYGSVYGGHYICYKKMNDKWFLTNDTSIREVTLDAVLKCEAYILFYEKP